MQQTTPTTAVLDEIRDLLDERIRERSFDLPLLPEVATQVMTLASSADSDAVQLSEVLHRDQAFASHVLRVANSPAMLPKVPIVSLQQAVSRIGMSMISEIAIAISLQSKTFNVKGHMDLVRKLWRHSLATGWFAKEIARMRRRNVENSFLCGLLHDVGKPIVLATIGELEKSRNTRYDDAILHAALDAYHCEVGFLLCEAWGLPEQVKESVRWHHDFAGAPRFSEVAMTVSLADMIAHLTVPTTHEVTEQEVRDLDVVVELNLYPDDLDEIVAMTENVERMVEATS